MKLIGLFTILLLTACSVLRWPQTSSIQTSPARQMASDQKLLLLREDIETFRSELSNKYLALHGYYAIGQKNLLHFDQDIKELKLEALYKSPSYLSLLAVKAQVDEIESEVFGLWVSLSQSKVRGLERLLILEEGITQFAKLSKSQGLAMENLMVRLNLKPETSEQNLSENEIELIFKELENSVEFQVFDKNIEHLSYMLEMDINEASSTSFKPSTQAEGSISGQEFPAKVWALSYNQGPSADASRKILKILGAHKLSATFFMNVENSFLFPKETQEIKNAGMEIASGGLSSIPLHKVGDETLDKEITQSTLELNTAQGVKVELYRLPYGAGVSVHKIRQKILEGNMIHVLWNVDSLDWMAQSSDRISERTLRLMKKTSKDSGIILFHDNHERTLKATDAILKTLDENNRRVCTIGRIMNEMNQGQKAICLPN